MNRRKSVVTIILIVMVFSPLLAGCNSTFPWSAPQKGGYYFPQQAAGKGDRAGLDSYLRGELVSVDGCLRVVSPDTRRSYLIVWPPNLSLEIVNGLAEIQDKAINAQYGPPFIIRLGDTVRMDGDEIQTGDSGSTYKLRYPIPKQCPGPYWAVSHWVRLPYTHVLGKIIQFNVNRTKTPNISIEGLPAKNMLSKAVMTIDGETEVFKQNEDGFTRMATTDLELGQTVDAYFRGSITNSIPPMDVPMKF